MHPAPPGHGNRDVCGNGRAGRPFSGQMPAVVSRLPFFSITIQNCHGAGSSATWHRSPRYSSFAAA
jgi:hypothetical protein